MSEISLLMRIFTTNFLAREPLQNHKDDLVPWDLFMWLHGETITCKICPRDSHVFLAHETNGPFMEKLDPGKNRTFNIGGKLFFSKFLSLYPLQFPAFLKCLFYHLIPLIICQSIKFLSSIGASFYSVCVHNPLHCIEHTESHTCASHPQRQ